MNEKPPDSIERPDHIETMQHAINVMNAAQDFVSLIESHQPTTDKMTHVIYSSVIFTAETKLAYQDLRELFH